QTTAKLRKKFRLNKTKRKPQKTFSAHCVDSWVMAASVSGASQPTEKRLYYIKEIRLHRRQLHRLQLEPGPGGRLMRKPLGGTRALGFKIGTVVKHLQCGLSSIGGSLKEKISLDAYPSNKRLMEKAKVEDCTRLTFTPY